MTTLTDQAAPAGLGDQCDHYPTNGKLPLHRCVSRAKYRIVYLSGDEVHGAKRCEQCARLLKISQRLIKVEELKRTK